MATKVLYCFQHYSILSHDLSDPEFFPVIYLRDSYDGVTVNKAIAWNDKEDFPVVFYYVALDFSRKKNIRVVWVRKNFVYYYYFSQRDIFGFFSNITFFSFLKVIDKR